MSRPQYQLSDATLAVLHVLASAKRRLTPMQIRLHIKARPRDVQHAAERLAVKGWATFTDRKDPRVRRKLRYYEITEAGREAAKSAPRPGILQPFRNQFT